MLGWLLIWQQIRIHIWKCLFTNMGFTLSFRQQNWLWPFFDPVWTWADHNADMRQGSIDLGDPGLGGGVRMHFLERTWHVILGGRVGIWTLKRSWHMIIEESWPVLLGEKFWYLMRSRQVLLTEKLVTWLCDPSQRVLYILFTEKMTYNPCRKIGNIINMGKRPLTNSTHLREFGMWSLKKGLAYGPRKKLVYDYWREIGLSSLKRSYYGRDAGIWSLTKVGKKYALKSRW